MEEWITKGNTECFLKYKNTTNISEWDYFIKHILLIRDIVL